MEKDNIWLFSNREGEKPVTVSHMAASDSHRDGGLVSGSKQPRGLKIMVWERQRNEKEGEGGRKK